MNLTNKAIYMPNIYPVIIINSKTVKNSVTLCIMDGVKEVVKSKGTAKKWL